MYLAVFALKSSAFKLGISPAAGTSGGAPYAKIFIYYVYIIYFCL
jgi:hypothetical protein